MALVFKNPIVCLTHNRKFDSEDAFVEHLKKEHKGEYTFIE